MAIYLSVDAGGSKVKIIAYDEDFKPILRCRVGSFRRNTTPKDVWQAHLDDLLTQLSPLRGRRIGLISGVLDGGFADHIATLCPVDTVRNLGEAKIGLGASCIDGDAMLALSGTGCTIFAREKGNKFSCGGYGAVIDDSGSGYHMGRSAFVAAIESYEGRGPHTVLTDLICEKLGHDDLRQAIFSIYKQNEIAPIALVASCSKLVSTAAESGDTVALNILKSEGELVSKQVLTLHRKAGLACDIPITISGGNWHAHHTFFDSFASAINRELPKAPLIIPRVEPIVGPIYLHAAESRGCSLSEAARELEIYYDEEKFIL
jgi:N-acetylglucosamine kinase-like BadF-type ATPase